MADDSFSLDSEREAVDAVGAMRRRLYRRSSDRVLCDFLEDDLAQARLALDDLSAYLDGAVEALGAAAVRPEGLFDRADDPAPLRALDELGATLSSLRRRLALVAGRARLAGPSRSR
ncbi:MAG TPA: hypothetical protein VMB50_23885 [Myxococcales bacterium]|nr:hypothetical protein [Myxococcales bacterium]